MAEIKVNNGNIEDALKRFKRQCVRNGVLQEVRKREHYEKPSVKRKKNQKQQEKENFKYIETEVKTQNNLCFLNNYIKAGKNIQSKGENKYVL